jgi:hypothetical protein
MENTARDAENGSSIADAAPIGGSFGFGGIGSTPSTFGISQDSASAWARLPSATGVETGAYTTNTAAYSGTANIPLRLWFKSVIYTAPLFTSEPALPLYPTSTSYVTTHHSSRMRQPWSTISNGFLPQLRTGMPLLRYLVLPPCHKLTSMDPST